MKKVINAILLLSFLLMPNYMNAEVLESNEKVVSEVVKYYKTVEKLNLSKENQFNKLYSNLNNNSITYEITKDEYDNAEVDINLFGGQTVETTYKKLSSTIYSYDSYYRYKAVLTWKNMPSKRSYDIIAIGYDSNVMNANSPKFGTTYCYISGGCKTSSTFYSQYFSNGVGVSFKLPEGDLKSLETTLYFDVKKKNNSTIYNLNAAADYSHATKTVTLDQSKKYSVRSNGIILEGIDAYYDGMSSAIATWNGIW